MICQVVYYASKTLNEAQHNYTTTEKELLAVVFAFDKFCSYLIRFKVVVFKDHSAPQVFSCKERGQTKVDKMGLTSPRV